MPLFKGFDVFLCSIYRDSRHFWGFYMKFGSDISGYPWLQNDGERTDGWLIASEIVWDLSLNTGLASRIFTYIYIEEWIR